MRPVDGNFGHAQPVPRKAAMGVSGQRLGAFLGRTIFLDIAK